MGLHVWNAGVSEINRHLKPPHPQRPEEMSDEYAFPRF